MKLSVGVISILLTSVLALSVKRQNDVPGCVDGDVTDDKGSPYEGQSDCTDDCYLTEKSGDRVGQICKGYCEGTPLWTGGVVYNCFGKT
ncbi:hypothetical protein BCR34DRAFT_611455 [Clohesyomyces aquaticus]|uniref:Secreted protein n=1 Tax=Clohesyomyces aquaticus TaxID=1231657 RepID=A0A1Y2A256_9PLEO|nr:hypothetical protein BCR34DRAFT_611455 [Clohesyomyces aquaticus]